MLNGTFRVDNSALTLILSDATTDFDVPSTACLSVNAGVVRVAYNTGGGAGSADLKLTGKLEVLGGTMLIGNTADARDNDIEYAAGGVPIIDVQGGQLTVSGQIRRSISITTGALNYLQSGGVTTIYGNNLAASRAKLEVLNPGSVFRSHRLPNRETTVARTLPNRRDDCWRSCHEPTRCRANAKSMHAMANWQTIWRPTRHRRPTTSRLPTCYFSLIVL